MIMVRFAAGSDGIIIFLFNEMNNNDFSMILKDQLITSTV